MPYNPQTGYTPGAVSGYIPANLFSFGAGSATGEGVQTQPRFEARVVDRIPNVGDIVHWRVVIESAAGGLNSVVGAFNETYDRVRDSTLDTRWHRTLILPQVFTVQNTPDASTFFQGVHMAYFNDRVYIAAANDANASLFRETSATDPTIVAVTYDPAAPITSLSVVTAGSANAAARLAVGRHTATTRPVQLLDTSHVATSMHADTSNCWGIIQTFINNNALLIYSDGALRSLDSTVAVTTQPTVTLTNVPRGGCALGMVKLAGAPIRPCWLWPHENQSNSMFSLGAEKPGRVVTTHSEGDDYQSIPMGLTNVYAAQIVEGNAIVATDNKRVMYYDGRSAARDLGWVSEREPNSDVTYRVRYLATNGPEIWALVERQPVSGSGTTFWWEVYDLLTNSWHQVSSRVTTGSASNHMDSHAGTWFPSPSTRFMHAWERTRWRRIFAPNYGENPFSLYRRTGGAGATTGNEFEATGNYTSPEWELPGLEGWPKVVSRIIFLGDVDAGGTAAVNASVVVCAGGVCGAFEPVKQGDDTYARAQYVDFPDNQNIFYRLQVTMTVARNPSNTRHTPNALPVVIEGYAFVKELPAPSSFLMDYAIDARLNAPRTPYVMRG